MKTISRKFLLILSIIFVVCGMLLIMPGPLYADSGKTLTSITVYPNQTTVVAENSIYFTAIGTYSDNSTADITTSVSVNWSSADTNIATIGPNSGVATGVSAGGPITITATSGEISGTASLTVTAAEPGNSGKTLTITKIAQGVNSGTFIFDVYSWASNPKQHDGQCKVQVTNGTGSGSIIVHAGWVNIEVIETEKSAEGYDVTYGTLEHDQEGNAKITVTNKPKTEPTTYTVTYNANGGTGTPPVDNSSPYASGATVTVLGNTDLANGSNVFDHWNTAPDNSGTSYAPNTTFIITADTILYAIYTAPAPTGGGGGGAPAPTPTAAITVAAITTEEPPVEEVAGASEEQGTIEVAGISNLPFTGQNSYLMIIGSVMLALGISMITILTLKRRKSKNMI